MRVIPVAMQGCDMAKCCIRVLKLLPADAWLQSEPRESAVLLLESTAAALGKHTIAYIKCVNLGLGVVRAPGQKPFAGDGNSSDSDGSSSGASGCSSGSDGSSILVMKRVTTARRSRAVTALEELAAAGVLRGLRKSLCSAELAVTTKPPVAENHLPLMDNQRRPSLPPP